MKAVLKFVPVILLAGLMISGQDALIAAPIATIFSVIIAKVTEGLSFRSAWMQPSAPSKTLSLHYSF